MILENESLYNDRKFPTICRICCIIEVLVSVFAISLIVIGFIIHKTAGEFILKPENLIWLNVLLALYYFGTFKVQEIVRIASLRYSDMNPHSDYNSFLLSIFSAVNDLFNFVVLCKYILIGAEYYNSYREGTTSFMVILIMTYWFSNIFKLHDKK